MQAHTLALSSTTTGANSMGVAGSIYTLSGGYSRRWMEIGDVEEQDFRWYTNALFPINGLPTGWNDNITLSYEVARAIVRIICSGGLEYSMDGVAPPRVAEAWPMIDFGLVEL